MNSESVEAFRWIVQILNENDIPFQITGGLAAIAYGSKRPLYDIDIDVKNGDLEKLAPLLKGHIVYGPQRFKSDAYDLMLMSLDYNGQKIDIDGCDDDKLYSHISSQWEDGNTDIEKAIEMEIFGVMVPVIARQKLIDYKKKVNRPTDLEDVRYIEEKTEL